MSNADWYPKRLSDKVPWHANYKAQTAATGGSLGYSAGDISQAASDADETVILNNYKQLVVDFAQAVTEYIEIVLNGDPLAAMPAVPTPPAAITVALGAKPGIQARTRGTANVNKATAGFTPAIGELYGIIAPAAGPAATPQIDSATPQQCTSNVDLDLFKGGYSILAIDLRQSGGAWVQIGVSQTEHFLDTTPPLVAGQPEKREYRVQGMVNNARTGDLSDIVSTVTVP